MSNILFCPSCGSVEFAKKRYIDPFVKDKGRLSSIDNQIKKEIDEFLNQSQDYYIKGV